MLARGIEQAVQEGRGAAHLPFHFKPFQAEHHRGAVLAAARGEAGDLAHRIIHGLDRDMAIGRERDEIAFRVDHDLLHLAGAALHQPAEQIGFARAGIALDEQACGEQLLQIDMDRFARAVRPHIYLKRHAVPLADRGAEGQVPSDGMRLVPTRERLVRAPENYVVRLTTIMAVVARADRIRARSCYGGGARAGGRTASPAPSHIHLTSRYCTAQ